MSRESWFNQCTPRFSTSNDWREAFRHRRMEGRTTDPEAMDWDKASDIFLQGLKLARRGDYGMGRTQIATAYLLDIRSIIFMFRLPVGEEEEARDKVLDAKLIFDMINHDTFAHSSMVLQIMKARYFGQGPDGQTHIAMGMQAIDHLLRCIKEKPELGGHWSQGGLLGGCMTQVNLLRNRSSLYMAMGNHKKAANDFSLALKIDPTSLSFQRASLWAHYKLKDPATIHAEFKKVVAQAHPDSPALEVAYGFLAHFTLVDPSLGTVQQAKEYYDKSLRAGEREKELYMSRALQEDPSIVQVCKRQFETFFNAPPAERKFREDCDAAVLSGLFENLQIPDNLTQVPAAAVASIDERHKCLSCGKTARDIGKLLSKCSRCKKVSYCSKDCQRADWKGHKNFCMITSSTKEVKPKAAKPTKPTHHAP